MKKITNKLFYLVIVFLIFNRFGICHSITNIQLSPSSPDTLAFDQHVDISYDYQTDEASGVRIWVNAYTDGSETRNTATQGSLLHPVGSGSGTTYFFISSDEVIVDSIRLYMHAEDSGELLHEIFTPVYYFYTDSTNLSLTDINFAVLKTINLHQNFPNPFNPSTKIEYSIPNNSQVNIIIYDLMGKEVKTLVNDTKKVGQYQVKWSGTDDSGQSVSGGIYFYKLQAGDFIQTRKMVLMR
jgi:hypothetical protein